MNQFKSTFIGAAAAALVLAGTSGATHLGSLQLGHANTSTDPTILTANLANPVFKVVNQGSAAALRGDAQNGIGVNGVSISGIGQQGESQTGIGLAGAHKATTGSNAGVQGTTASTDPLSAGVVGKNSGGGAGLRSIVNAGAPPLLVNSNVKVANLNADLLDGFEGSSFWKLGGNAGTTPGTDFLGTTDNQALELKVNGQRGLRIEPAEISPNLVGGYPGNSIDSGQAGSVIAGGGFDFPSLPASNHVENSWDFIGAGYANQVTGGASGVVSGTFNVASGTLAFVGGGYTNIASGQYSTVTGGQLNDASGVNSTVAGGGDNTASGDASFAAGTSAQATHYGSFVWGDGTFSDVTSAGDNSFTVRASGGIWLGTNSSPAIGVDHFIDTSTGGYLSSAGAWTNASDRAKKHGFRPLNTRRVLEGVARMPITSWSYKAENPSVRHIGPMAQDFYKSFGLGLDNKHITTIDEGGVALAAIQGLYRENQKVHRENVVLRRTNAGLSMRLDRLEQAMATLENELDLSRQASGRGGER